LGQIVNDTSIWSQENKNNMNLAIIVMDHQNLSINGLIGGFAAYNSVYENVAFEYFGQPGSAFSPLSVYAPALDNGIVTEATIIADEPVYEIQGHGWPQNWDRTFGAPVSVREGFQRQLNTVATAIIKDLTPELSYMFLKNNFNFTALNDDMDINAFISIGALSYGVTPLQLLSAYQIFGRNGDYAKPFSYSKVFDMYGNEILHNDVLTVSSKHVITKNTADLIYDMMTGGVDYARAVEVNVAGRIGYVNNRSEIWYVGMTPQYAFLLYLSCIPRDKKLTDEALSQSHLAFTQVIEAICS
jgi:penicillin-binding protein 1A